MRENCIGIRNEIIKRKIRLGKWKDILKDYS